VTGLPPLRLRAYPGRLAVCRLEANDPLPAWATAPAAPLVAIARTQDELSIVCPEERLPAGVRAERGWRAIGVVGPLDFGLTGIMAALSGALAAVGISLFAISTYDTDYILVKEEALDRALDALRRAVFQAAID